jgi:NAD(P)-dependent dehydrogenase (short-subunit alcohol dehydrogenase family)
MKVAIVTGGTNGFGYATCKLLLKQGFRVIITSRNLGRATKAAEELTTEVGGESCSAIAMTLDLNDLTSVISFASEYQTKYSGNGDVLVYLILNAGIVKLKRDISPQGLEETYATNHFGGAALFNMLLTNTIAIAITTNPIAVKILPAKKTAA